MVVDVEVTPNIVNIRLAAATVPTVTVDAELLALTVGISIIVSIGNIGSWNLQRPSVELLFTGA